MFTFIIGNCRPKWTESVQNSRFSDCKENSTYKYGPKLISWAKNQKFYSYFMSLWYFLPTWQSNSLKMHKFLSIHLPNLIIRNFKAIFEYFLAISILLLTIYFFTLL